MDKEPNRTSVDIDEMAFLLELLTFIREHAYADITISVHTDNFGIKQIRVTEGRRLNFKFKL